MKFQKLSEYARDNGLTYQTAYNHFKKGLVQNVKVLPTGTILVGIQQEQPNSQKRTVIYCRVSSAMNKSNLESQADRLQKFAVENGMVVAKVVKEIASGMNDSRPKLQQVLSSTDWDFLLVEHKDRLTRFGFNYIETLLETKNKKILVANPAVNDDENLMEDLISIIYSFSARMYGKRRSKTKSKKLIEELQKAD